MKLLKQFHSVRLAHTPLKRGVNERAVWGASRQYRKSDLINTQLQLGAISTASGNRFNGFPD